MLTEEMRRIISGSEDLGWVIEPQAKRIFSMAGLDVPRFMWAKEIEDAIDYSHRIGYPVVAKVVSPKVIHKSEVRGVTVGIDNDLMLKEAFENFQRIDGFDGMLVEEMVSGVELMAGAKRDYQFGPVILLGMGGTGVEIYRDISLRMAPLAEKDIKSMVRCLKGKPLLEGFRGKEAIDLDELARMLRTFSALVMDLQGEMESIDLNPVICTTTQCIIADARIMLRTNARNGNKNLVTQ